MQDNTDHDDPVSAKVLVHLYPELHRVASVVAPPDIDPADLVQDAFVRLLARRSGFAVTNPAAYLTTTIVHLASNRRRSFLRRRRAYAAHGPIPAAATPAYPSDLSVLDAVTPRERAILYLHDVEGLPFKDVADHVGVTVAAARKIAERARRHLRPLVKDEAHVTQ